MSGIICVMIQVNSGPSVAVRARFFHGLADPSRLAILESLREGERTAGEIAQDAGLSASNASRHLACLRDCGLVDSRQDWRFVYYRLAAGVELVLATADGFIAQVADRVAACQRPEMGGPP